MSELELHGEHYAFSQLTRLHRATGSVSPGHIVFLSSVSHFPSSLFHLAPVLRSTPRPSHLRGPMSDPGTPWYR